LRTDPAGLYCHEVFHCLRCGGPKGAMPERSDPYTVLYRCESCEKVMGWAELAPAGRLYWAFRELAGSVRMRIRRHGRGRRRHSP